MAVQTAPRRIPTAERPKLVFFYGERSGPSRTVEALLSQILQRRMNHSTFSVLRVCAERNPELLERFQVRELPTLVVVEGRRIELTLRGNVSQLEIAEALSRWLH